MKNDDKKMKIWALLNKLDLHFYFEQRVSSLGRLLLYSYLSSDDFIKNNIDSFYLEEENRFHSMVEAVRQSPQDSYHIITDFFQKIAECAKNDKAKELLSFIYLNNDDLRFFKEQGVKLAKIVDLVYSVIDIESYLEYERYQWSPQYRGREISDGVTSIITALTGKELKHARNIFCPVSGQSYSAEKIATKNNIRDISIQDIDRETIVLSLALLLSHGYKFEQISFRVSDFLLDTEIQDDSFDLQIACLPFGRTLMSDESELIKRDPYYLNFFGGKKPIAEIIYLKKIIDGMIQDGRAYVQIAGKMINSRDELSASFRRILIDSGVLEGVIKLPERSSPFSTISSYILVLHKSENSSIYFDDDNAIKFVNDISKQDGEIVRHIGKSEVLFNEILNTDYYLKKPILDKIMSGEGSRKLIEVAEILTPIEDYESYGKLIDLKSLQGYPLYNQTALREGHSSVAIKKGDIIMHGQITSPKIYLVDEEVDYIFAPKNTVVIRPKNIQPEYLAIYLGSEATKTSLEIIQSIKGLGYRMFTSVYVTEKILIDFPVPKPGKTPEEYRKIFEIENKLISDYDDFSEFLDSYPKSDAGVAVSIDDILDEELLRNAPRYQEEVFEKCVGEDMKELKICYNCGAYKAATILAGSILEAVLIDWISDIDKKDYFKKQYKVEDENTGKKRRAGLGDYIDAIKFIKRPKWLEEAEKAHHIRKMRNTVHAKISIKSKIDKNECDQVVKYLQDVLVSRKQNS